MLWQACQEQLPENEEAASLDPDNPEFFFYSLQYDHTVKRFETVWLERDAHIKQPTRRVEVRSNCQANMCQLFWHDQVLMVLFLYRTIMV